jgi:MATE family multidrug resistance protein
MFSLPAVSATASRAAPLGLVRELRAMLALALPLVLTQLTQILVHTTEVVMLGRLGAASLAAATLAAALFHTGMLFGIGVASATAPLIAQARGARQPRQVRRVVRQGLWVALAVTLPLMTAMWFVRPLLAAMGQDPALFEMTEAYMRAALWGLPFSVGFIVLRSFAAAFGHARAILMAALAAALINIPMSWALIFGRLGLPPLGTRGAGIAVAISYALMFGLLLVYCLTANPLRRYNAIGRLWRPDWATLREILRVGLPIGGAVVMETGLFAASTLFMGLIGTAQLAAHQIALQLASIAFMVPLGLSHAATIRIGLAAGADDWPRTRLAGWVACGLGTAFMGAMAVLFATAPGALVGLFLDPATAEGAAAFAFAIGFLRIAALFQLVDGLQVIGIASLRGLKDTAVPMWLAGFGYWLVGFPICWVLGFHTPLGGNGIWIGLAFALATVAVVMVLRFERLTRCGARRLNPDATDQRPAS